MISEAFEAWDALWGDIGTSHFAPTGILAISLEAGDGTDIYREGLDRTGFAYELLEPGEAAERYPFLDAASMRYAFFSAEGGVLFFRAHRARSPRMASAPRRGPQRGNAGAAIDMRGRPDQDR